MRALLFIPLIFFIIAANAQTQLQVAKFDNTFKLKDGIYTSYTELLNNAPAFPDCILDVNPNDDKIYISSLKYYIIGHKDDLMQYNSNLLATVLNGRLSIYMDNRLTTVYSKGALCSFAFTKTITRDYNNLQNGTGGSSTTVKSYIYFLDLQNGTISKLSKDNLGMSIKRDPDLYQMFLKTKPGKRNKNLYKYIAEFNTRNPLLLPIREKTEIIEEE